MEAKSEIKPTLEVIAILNTLRGIFQQLESLERNKRDVILKRKPKELGQIALAQEDLLREVHRLELLLGILFQEISHKFGQEVKSLSDLELIPELSSSLRQKISSLRVELHELAMSLQTFALGNEKILKDNLEFFQEILRSYGEYSLFYGQAKGGVVRPLIVDSTV